MMHFYCWQSLTPVRAQNFERNLKRIFHWGEGQSLANHRPAKSARRQHFYAHILKSSQKKKSKKYKHAHGRENWKKFKMDGGNTHGQRRKKGRNVQGPSNLGPMPKLVPVPQALAHPSAAPSPLLFIFQAQLNPNEKSRSLASARKCPRDLK